MGAASGLVPVWTCRPVFGLQSCFSFWAGGEFEDMRFAVILHAMLVGKKPFANIEDVGDTLGCRDTVCSLERGWDSLEKFGECCDAFFLQMSRNAGEELVNVFVRVADHKKTNFDLHKKDIK